MCVKMSVNYFMLVLVICSVKTGEQTCEDCGVILMCLLSIKCIAAIGTITCILNTIMQGEMYIYNLLDNTWVKQYLQHFYTMDQAQLNCDNAFSIHIYTNTYEYSIQIYIHNYDNTLTHTHTRIENNDYMECVCIWPHWDLWYLELSIQYYILSLSLINRCTASKMLMFALRS